MTMLILVYLLVCFIVTSGTSVNIITTEGISAPIFCCVCNCLWTGGANQEFMATCVSLQFTNMHFVCQDGEAGELDAFI
eukprot:5071512-Amphidinium_carterae.1